MKSLSDDSDISASPAVGYRISKHNTKIFFMVLLP
jgi:hypothetical protein